MNRREIRSGMWMMCFGLFSFGFGICFFTLGLLGGAQSILNELGKNTTFGVGAFGIILGSALIVNGIEVMVIGAHASDPAAREEPESFLERLFRGHTLEH